MQNLNILLFEDDELLQRLQVKLFDSMGHSTTGVEDCQKGLEVLKKQTFDIIFMDINMPGINGIECTRKIQALGIDTPIVALSGHDRESTQEECFAAGMCAFLEKPTNKVNFNALISELLG
ncbi:response regulator [Thiomicrorhabdus sediminis]|uniref:Response regulator n=1 Tax=Thiomicrorhabdus sediminis TaxID=2580412 RepID=A0A4P9K553_9GAMM|nr:response regulator [Thiomicrorhabdus sediminis]QCU89901.1 response regulator [Thiomicrorhabdus sediminis]